MSVNTFAIREAENKKKGMRVTIVLHIAIVLLLLFPFMSIQPEQPKQAAFVVLDFTEEFRSAAKKSSTKKAADTKGEKKKAVKKEVKKKKPTPKPTPAPTAKKKPVVTTHEPAPKIETKPNTAPVKVDVPMKDPTPEVPEVTEKVEKVEEVVEEDASEATKTETGTSDATGGADAAGSTNGDGEGTQGSSNSGKSKTDGVANEGDQGLDFSGTGIFNRKVIFRADIAKVIKEEGKIVVNLCINQEGRVVYAKYNRELSTIRTSNVVRKAIDATTSYRYAKDYTAPKKQCGKLTFNIIDIEEE